MTKNKTEALVLKTEQGVTLTDEQRIQDLLVGLRPGDKDVVMAATSEFLAARSQAGMFYLEMGKQLEAVRKILEPKEKFIEYIKALPHLSQATAYRMIWAYQNAQQMLPSATLKVAMEGGYKLISREKGGGFAEAYSEAVETVNKKMGPPPEDDPEKAKEWLTEVLKEKRRLAVRDKPEPPTAKELRDACLRPFAKAMERLPETERPEFVRELAGIFLKMAGLSRTAIKPVPVPRLR